MVDFDLFACAYIHACVCLFVCATYCHYETNIFRSSETNNDKDDICNILVFYNKVEYKGLTQLPQQTHTDRMITVTEG